MLLTVQHCCGSYVLKNHTLWNFALRFHEFRANFARISRAQNTRKLLNCITNCINILKNTTANQYWFNAVIFNWYFDKWKSYSCSMQHCKWPLLIQDPACHTVVVVNENQLFKSFWEQRSPSLVKYNVYTIAPLCVLRVKNTANTGFGYVRQCRDAMLNNFPERNTV